MVLPLIDLKKVDSQIVFQQNGFTRELQRIGIRDRWSHGEPQTSPEEQR